MLNRLKSALNEIIYLGKDEMPRLEKILGGRGDDLIHQNTNVTSCQNGHKVVGNKAANGRLEPNDKQL